MHRSIAAIVMSMAMTACTTVGSFHSAVGDDAVVGEDRLLGEWMTVSEDGDTVRVTVTRLSSTQYHFAMEDQEQQASSFDGHLVPLGDRLLLELSPGALGRDAIAERGGMFTYAHVVLEFGNATVRTAAFDGSALHDALRRDAAPRLEYVIRDLKGSEYSSTDLLLTSPPSALRAGLEYYSKDPQIVDDWDTWRRPRAAMPAKGGP